MLKKTNISIYEFKRIKYLKMITSLYDKFEITDDKIICYINNEKLEKTRSQTLGYNYSFSDIDIFKYNKSILTRYNLDKPIYYVIENMDFKDKIEFYIQKNAHLIFKNCTFNYQTQISGNDGGEVIFENNTYFSEGKHSLIKKPFVKINAGNIKFNNENFINTGDVENLGLSYFGIEMKSKTLELINSTLETNGKIDIESGEIDILFSKINCPEIIIVAEILDSYKGIITSENGTLDIISDETYLESSVLFASLVSIISKAVHSSKTRVIAKTGIIIENNSDNKLDNIVSPLTIYNGAYIPEDSKIIKEIELSKERSKLLQTLKNIKKINYFKQNLDKQTTEKVLKLGENYDRKNYI